MDPADDDNYEICNDNGFVYKRRRGLYPDVAPLFIQPAGPDPEAARHRRRRGALLRLRGRRLLELERWEALEGKLLAPLPASRPPPLQDPPSSSDLSVAANTSPSTSVLDDLLAQVDCLTERLACSAAWFFFKYNCLMPFSPLTVQAEVAEAILKQVVGFCDEVDVLCRMHEEDIADTIIALPVWGEPKYLVMSLQS
jgi:hypothetical protein